MLMTIINASFNRRSEAVAAVEALREAGFTMGRDMPLNADPEFEVSPEPATSPGAEDSAPSAARGAAVGSIVGIIAGLGATPFVGPAGAVAGAGVGAYTGSLLGALKGLDEKEVTEDERSEEGALLKVDVQGPKSRTLALDILRAHGAAHVGEEGDDAGRA
jgi:hypothetical protein